MRQRDCRFRERHWTVVATKLRVVCTYVFRNSITYDADSSVAEATRFRGKGLGRRQHDHTQPIRARTPDRAASRGGHHCLVAAARARRGAHQRGAGARPLAVPAGPAERCGAGAACAGVPRGRPRRGQCADPAARVRTRAAWRQGLLRGFGWRRCRRVPGLRGLAGAAAHGTGPAGCGVRRPPGRCRRPPPRRGSRLRCLRPGAAPARAAPGLCAHPVHGAAHARQPGRAGPGRADRAHGPCRDRAVHGLGRAGVDGQAPVGPGRRWSARARLRDVPAGLPAAGACAWTGSAGRGARGLGRRAVPPARTAGAGRRRTHARPAPAGVRWRRAQRGQPPVRTAGRQAGPVRRRRVHGRCRAPCGQLWRPQLDLCARADARLRCAAPRRRAPRAGADRPAAEPVGRGHRVPAAACAQPCAEARAADERRGARTLGRDRRHAQRHP